MSHDRFYRPILSADISAINLGVELVLISPRKSGDKIGRFYHSSVIGFSGSALVLTNEVNLRPAQLVLGWVTVSGVQPLVPETYLST